VVIALVVRLFNFPLRTSLLVGIGLSHVGEFSLIFSSKLHAHNLLTRRAYLLFLAASVSTLAVAPLVLRAVSASRWFAANESGLVQQQGGEVDKRTKTPSPVVVTEWRRWRG